MILTSATFSQITFDSTITLSIVLALCALFAPSITALINNCHHYKLRKLELKNDEHVQRSNLQYEKKFTIYKEFISLASSYPYHENPWDNPSNMEHIVQNALLVCDEETRCLLLDFQKITSGRGSFSQSYILDLITHITLSFSRELNSLSMRDNNKRK